MTFAEEVRAQTPPPRLIHRLEFDAITDPSKFLEVVNVGDRGSMFDDNGTWLNSTVKDGFDDFAVLLDPPEGVSGKPKIWIYDGRTGQRYHDPADPNTKLSYVFENDHVNIPPPGGLCADGGKDLTGDAYPDLLVGCPGTKIGNADSTGAVYVLDMFSFQPDVEQAPNLRIDNPDAGAGGDGAKFGASVAIMGNFAGTASAEILVGAMDYFLDPAAGFDGTGQCYFLDLQQPNLSPMVLARLAEPIDPAGPPGTPCDYGACFGWQVAVVGNIATKVAGADVYGRDGTPEVAISDPFWLQNNPFVAGCTPVGDYNNGFVAWFNSFNLVGQQAPTIIGPSGPGIVGPAYPGPFGFSDQFGQYLVSGGDFDNGRVNAASVTASWDFSWLGNNPFRHAATDPNAITAALPVTGFSGGVAVSPLWPTGVDPGDLSQAHGNQFASVGDIDRPGRGHAG